MIERNDRNKRKTGGTPSLNDEKWFENTSNRSGGTHPGDMVTTPGGDERNFNMLVDSVPYLVQASPFTFNGETRFKVSINGNEEHIFTWDSQLKRLIAIDDDSSTLPANLEMAISDKLQSMI
jgi:hypothetical protein